MQSSFIIFLGAGIGGVMRHLMNTWVAALMGSAFPYGILAINVLGSTAMGLAAGWFAFRSHASPEARLFITTGVLGGFTTFSAFSLDTALLIERNQFTLAAIYVAGSVVLSVLGLFAGLWSIRAAIG
jgi:CrcB protein